MWWSSDGHLFVTANLPDSAVTKSRLKRCKVLGWIVSATTPSGRFLSCCVMCASASWRMRAILFAVVGAVGCSVSTQYGVKFLVDTFSVGPGGNAVWIAFGLLVSLIAADNLLWRLAGWIASHAFVGVTGDLRSELFRHLTGHAPSYFTQRLAGTLTGRITATSNAAFAVENLFIWNVLPPCLATIGAIAYLAVVSIPMALALSAIAALVMLMLFRLAARGAPLHHGFANRAARVEGELADVIGNMPLVRTFGALGREHSRFDRTVGREMTARRRSLQYLERLRLLHAALTIVLTVAVLAWAITLWQSGQASAGDVVLVCTLGFTVLHATRDLAVALVDVTQHMARLAEAIATLLEPHSLREHPEAVPLVPRREGMAFVAFENVSFAYPGGRKVFDDFSLRIAAGRRTGLVGPSGGGKSTALALLQRFHDVDRGRILIDGQDIAHITQESLRRAISFVPQDISLLHRSILENIRYGRPEASDREVKAAAEAARCRDFIEALPERLLDDRRRPRHAAVGRPAPTYRHRPRAPQGFAHRPARRGDVLARRRIGGIDPPGTRPTDAGSHRDRHRPPSLDPAQLRPHRRPRSWPRDPGRLARGAAAPRRPLPRADGKRAGPAAAGGLTSPT